MQYFAHPVDGVVREVLSIPDDAHLADCFQEEFAAQLVRCGADVDQGWTYDGAAFAVPVIAPPSIEALLVYANQKQWALAIGGYTVAIGGQALTFLTDGESRSLLDGKVARLGKPNPPATINWQFGIEFVDIDAAAFEAAAIQVADFVQATFDALKPVFVAIQAGTITTFAEVDAADWPADHA